MLNQILKVVDVCLWRHFALQTRFIKRSAKNSDTLADDMNWFFIIVSSCCQYTSIAHDVHVYQNVKAHVTAAQNFPSPTPHGTNRCVCMHTVCTEFCATPTFHRFQVRPCEICGGHSGTVTGVPESTSVFPCQYHFASAPSVVSVQCRHVAVCWQYRTSLSTGQCLQRNAVTVSVPDSTSGSHPSSSICHSLLYRLLFCQLRQVPQLTNLLRAAQCLLKI